MLATSIFSLRKAFYMSDNFRWFQPVWIYKTKCFWKDRSRHYPTLETTIYLLYGLLCVKDVITANTETMICSDAQLSGDSIVHGFIGFLSVPESQNWRETWLFGGSHVRCKQNLEVRNYAFAFVSIYQNAWSSIQVWSAMHTWHTNPSVSKQMGRISHSRHAWHHCTPRSCSFLCRSIRFLFINSFWETKGIVI